MSLLQCYYLNYYIPYHNVAVLRKNKQGQLLLIGQSVQSKTKNQVDIIDIWQGAKLNVFHALSKRNKKINLFKQDWRNKFLQWNESKSHDIRNLFSIKPNNPYWRLNSLKTLTLVLFSQCTENLQKLLFSPWKNFEFLCVLYFAKSNILLVLISYFCQKITKKLIFSKLNKVKV